MFLNQLITRRRTFIGIAALGAALTCVNNATAESDSLWHDDLLLYGIERNSGNLVRYAYDMDVLTTLGQVTTDDGTVLRGIEASAYISGFTNLFGFWRDPSDHTSKLMYINIDTGDATKVGSSLGPDLYTGAVAVTNEDSSDIYAIKVWQPVAYTIEDGSVVSDEHAYVRLDVLGSAITSSDGYKVPVTMRVEIAEDIHEPFGSIETALGGNINDNNNPREHIVPVRYGVGTHISLSFQSWQLKSGEDGADNSDWYKHTAVNSANDTLIHILKTGDKLADLPEYMNRASIATMIEDYIDTDTGVVTMRQDRVIYLVELGATPPHPAADFDDAVVVVSLGRSELELDEQYVPPLGLLVRVNHETGGVSPLMYLSHSYDSLASTDGDTLYATSGTNLYRIDRPTKSETLIGTVTGDSVIAIEQAGSVLVGFEMLQDHIITLDAGAGMTLEPGKFIGANDMGTIVITQEPDHPTDSYD